MEVVVMRKGESEKNVTIQKTLITQIYTFKNHKKIEKS